MSYNYTPYEVETVECRHVEEAGKVLEEKANRGLERGYKLHTANLIMHAPEEGWPQRCSAFLVYERMEEADHG